MLPRKGCGDRIDLLVGQERVLRVTAVESAPHLAHDGNDRLARVEAGVECAFDLPDALDS